MCARARPSGPAYLVVRAGLGPALGGPLLLVLGPLGPAPRPPPELALAAAAAAVAAATPGPIEVVCVLAFQALREEGGDG